MIPNQWPWTWEEEVKWQEELHREESGWMEDLMDHMIHDRTAASSYDPLEACDEVEEETIDA